jgi:S-adenosyl methyltransferase
VSVPSVPRVWNYMEGGRDNFEADRQAARHMLAAAPMLPQLGRAARAFYVRAISYLAAEAGIRQFLSVDLGMPTSSVTHETAQGIAPSCRVVYVASDPVAISHARALLRSAPEGVVDSVSADVRDIEGLLAGASKTLDFAEPVAVVMMDVLMFIEDASCVFSQLMEAMPSGSYAAVMQMLPDERLVMSAQRWNHISPVPVFFRHPDQVAGWFDGLELVDPGLVEVDQWRPRSDDPVLDGGVPLLGAVARKP